jgi:RIO-like serine/threonine protein kinase
VVEMKKMRGQIYGGQKWETLDGILELLRDSHWHSVKEIEEAIWLPEEKLADILCFFADFDLINYVDGKSRVKIMPHGLSILRLPPEE